MSCKIAAPNVSRDTPLASIDADPKQPRRHFDAGRLQELAESLAANGLASPILLRPAKDRFMIVHGERRFRAAEELGWESIPAVVVSDISAEDVPWIQLAENIQRDDLSPIEEATAYRDRLATGITQQQLADRIGKDRSYIAQKLRLLTLPPPLLHYLDRKVISEGHARQLLKLKSLYGSIPTNLERVSRDTSPDGLEANDGSALAFFLAIRPEDNPPYRIGARPKFKAAGVITEAMEIFESEDFETVPQWAVVAFWWASLAVTTELSVADLAKALDNWVARLFSAVIWWQTVRAGWERRLDEIAQATGCSRLEIENRMRFAERYPEVSKALDTFKTWDEVVESLDSNKDQDGLSVYELDDFGYGSDLRHAEIRTHVDDFEERNREAICKRAWNDALTVASAYQPWGFQHETYVKAQEREAS